MQQNYFKKEGMNQYMVMPFEGSPEGKYEHRLLQHSPVPFLLQYEMRVINGKQELYYRLQNKIFLGSVIENLHLDLFRLQNMADSIIGVLETMEEYLLNPDKILWQADKIFMDAETGRLQFCYYPESGFGDNELKDFLTELIQHVDKTEEDAMLFILQFYNLITEPDCTLERLAQFRQEKIRQSEKRTAIDEKYMHPEIPEEEYHKEGTTSIKETPQKRDGSWKKKLIAILLGITACTDLVLIGGLLLNLLPYGATRFLLFGVGALIFLIVIYMQMTKEESPDDIMREYFENNKAEYPEENLQRNIIEDNQKNEITRLLEQLPKEKQIVEESHEKELCLMAMERDKYPPIRIENESIVLGCMENGCSYLLQAKGISRMHAKLMHREDGIYLLDLNSTNGTYINGELVDGGQDYKLEEGDLIAFAQSQFYVVAVD